MRHIKKILIASLLFCGTVFKTHNASAPKTRIPILLSDDELIQRLPAEDQNQLHREATLMAKLLLTEDNRTQPWIMMASIVKNRADMCYRNKCTIKSVIHDNRQFSAVNSDKWVRLSKLSYGKDDKFDEAYEISRKILLRGVPEKYTNITHAYYPDTMVEVYGYENPYPSWDSPNNRLDNRGVVAGWVYGSTI